MRVILVVFLFGINGLYAQDWLQFGSDIDGQEVEDFFGGAIAMSESGNRLIAGAIGGDGDGSLRGSVDVYQWDGDNWLTLGERIFGEADGDFSGQSVDISADGNRIAVGANANDGFASNAGHVRVYEWDGTNWNQLGADIDGVAAEDESGFDLALNNAGNRIIIGAPENDETADLAGQARVYEWDGTSWNQMGTQLNGEAEADEFGSAVTINAAGNRIAVGAPKNDGTGIFAGHVRVFEWDGMDWIQLGIDIDGEEVSDGSGQAVALDNSGSRLVIGGPSNSDAGSNAGHVRVYEWDGMAWTQVGPDINGALASDGLGFSVAINADGTKIMSGGPGNDGSEPNAGHARVYEFDGISWVRIAQDIDGEAEEDQSGRSVAMDATGNIVAIGAFGNDDGGDNAGHVRAYTLCDLDLSISEAGNVYTANASGGGITYQWINCMTNEAVPGEINQNFTPTEDGFYTVIITDGRCKDQPVCFEFSTVGLNEKELDAFVQLYPNPTNGIFTLNLSDSFEQGTEVEIYNLLGEIIFKQLTMPGENKIDLLDQPKGVYFVRLTNQSVGNNLKLILK